MELNDFFRLIGRRKQSIAVFVVLFFALGVLVSIVQPMRYSSQSKLLVMHKAAQSSDSYTISKSNQYFASLFASVLSSNFFYGEVLNSNFSIDKDYFSGNLRQQMKKWGKTVEARASSDTGIISITVYHTDPSQAEQISTAINYLMKEKGQLFHSYGDNVSIKVIDQPIVSRWPTKPNLPLNALLSSVFGFFVALIYIYAFPGERYDLRISPSRPPASFRDYTPDELPLAPERQYQAEHLISQSVSYQKPQENRVNNESRRPGSDYSQKRGNVDHLLN